MDASISYRSYRKDCDILDCKMKEPWLNLHTNAV